LSYAPKSAGWPNEIFSTSFPKYMSPAKVEQANSG